MDVCKAKRLMALEEENAKLKKLRPQQSSMRLPFASELKNWPDPAAKRATASGRGSAWPVARYRQRAAAFRLPPVEDRKLVAEQWLVADHSRTVCRTCPRATRRDELDSEDAAQARQARNAPSEAPRQAADDGFRARSQRPAAASSGSCGCARKPAHPRETRGAEQAR